MVQAKADYLKYHRQIIVCEEAFLLSNDIPKALTLYRTLFNSYRKPFAKDCFVALQLACAINDNADLLYFFDKAFRRGVTWTAIGEAPTIAALLQNDASLRQKVEALYPVSRAVFEHQIDSPLRAAIISIKNRDDSFKMRTMIRAGAERERRQAEYISVLDSNTQMIVKLTRKHGFLSDNLIGLMDYGFSSDEEQRKRHCYQLRSLCDQLYYHHGCAYFLTASELNEALKSGEISPAMFALIYEWAFDNLKNGRPEMVFCKASEQSQSAVYNCGRFLGSGGSPDTGFVNTCRTKISLPSLEHEARKTAYAKAHKIRLQFGMFDCY